MTRNLPRHLVTTPSLPSQRVSAQRETLDKPHGDDHSNDARTDSLGREVAALAGESITDATRTAREERLARLLREQQRPADLSEIVRRGRARRTIDTRSEEEILGYAADGLAA